MGIRKILEYSFRSELLVDAVDEDVGSVVSNVAGGHAIAADNEDALGEESNVRGHVSDLQVGDRKPERVEGNVNATAGADKERAPLPLVVLVAKLHVGGDDREQSNDHQEEHEVQSKEAEHSVHARSEQAVEEVGEFSVDGGELDETKDRNDHPHAHKERLRRDRSLDFSDSSGTGLSTLKVASVGSNVARSTIEKVPANRAHDGLSSAIPLGGTGQPSDSNFDKHSGCNEKRKHDSAHGS